MPSHHNSFEPNTFEKNISIYSVSHDFYPSAKASYRDVTDILKSARGTIKLIVQHSSQKRRTSRGSNQSNEKEIIPGHETEIEIIKGKLILYIVIFCNVGYC